MGTMPIGAMEPGLEMLGAMGGVGVNGRIGPFAQRGLDEAFGFAIGARSVRACEEVAQTTALAGGLELMGAIARAVIAHETLRFNAQGSKVGQSALHERDRTLVVLLRHDLGKGQPRGIVNTDMDIFPTGAAHRVTPVESHAVAWMDDLGQLFKYRSGAARREAGAG